MRAYRRILVTATAFVALMAAPEYSYAESKSITALAVDPQTPTTLYAATSDARLLKSTDGGASWNVTGLTSSAAITAIAVDPQTPSTVYASDASVSGSVLFKSVDGGQSWSAISSLRYMWTSKLAIDPQTPTTLYMSAAGGIYKSTDGGSTWNQVTLYRPWFFDLAGVSDLVVDPLVAETLYVSVGYHINASEDGYFADTDFGEVLRSVDGGVNWSCILCADSGNGVFPAPVSLLAIATANPEALRSIYIADLYSNTIFRTVDDGFTFTTLAITPDRCCGIQALTVDGRDPATLFAVLPFAGVLKSGDSGTTWTAADTGLPDTRRVFVGSLLIDSQDPTILYAATAFGVFKSIDGGTSWAPTGLVQHSSLVSVSIDPASVAAGASATGTVTLLAPAPADGITVTLSSDNPGALALPATVTVPAGATSASFPISAGLLPNYVWVTISASHLDATKQTRVFVNARVIPSSLGLYPSSVIAGTNTAGLLQLSAAAPGGGAEVELSSSDPAVAFVPPSVTVPAWMPNAWFTISTASVAVPTTVTISATYSGVTTSALLTVNPAVTLASVILSAGTVFAGTSSIGTVTLSAPAPAGGAVIGLASSDAAVAAIPASVTVAAGVPSATFTISTATVPTSTAVTISGTYGGVTRSAVLTVTAPTLSSVSLNPAGVSGGTSSIGTVTLSGPAPAGGAGIVLSSSDAAIAVVPPGVTVAPGATSTMFTVSTSACASGTVTITAAAGGASRSAALTLTTTPDTVAIQIGDYFRKRQLLRVEATSTTSTAALSVYETSSGAFIGTLTRYNGSRYRGEFTWPLNPRNITVRSTLCGWAATDVALK
jgi:photosystem II stability/assembly factor-like uncharacterized protein